MKTLLAPSLVGVWRVKAEGAPTPYHIFAFHADGTVQQSNPAAGNAQTSDTSLMGVWKPSANGFSIHLEEFRQDYKTGNITRGTLDCMVFVKKRTFAGSCTFNVFGPEDSKLIEGPFAAKLKGWRVLPG
jgi:hypothetical protein